ncbi:hypothetical protein [Microbispora sp. KK1-11]|uniref:hypothetical protein n=1 Tax=Microbispora sp. KK1-11 TaxID=2053005 RepID=UPI00115BE205|nr:hypothetical protein [Microbispora sp. KK1-11]TQS26307.1 hypothetical protein FLW16_26555 [Microbispora sp. KK1-11]
MLLPRAFCACADEDEDENSQTESPGLRPSDLIVIEADGSYEQAGLRVVTPLSPVTSREVVYELPPRDPFLQVMR